MRCAVVLWPGAWAVAWCLDYCGPVHQLRPDAPLVLYGQPQRPCITHHSSLSTYLVLHGQQHQPATFDNSCRAPRRVNQPA